MAQETVISRRSRGLCIGCGLVCPEEGFVRCRPCKDKYRQRREKTGTASRKWQAEGSCGGCGKEPRPGRRLCEPCYLKRRANSTQRCEKARVQGICNKCETPTVDGRITCEGCLIKQRQLRREKRERGECASCPSTAVPGKVLCEKCEKKDRRSGLRRRRRFRTEVMAHYGGKCACCGETAIEFLTIDHIAGNGNRHRKEIGRQGGWRFYQWLQENGYPAGFRVLCFNCNCSIGHWGYCPHSRQEK